MKTIKCVIFDFGGVIGLPHSQFYINEMVKLTGVNRDALMQDYFHYRTDYDQGMIDTKTYWSLILDRHPIKLDNELIEKLRIIDASSWTQINYKMLDYIKYLKSKGIHLVLLSNINVGALAYIEENFEWLADFDNRFYSCDLKILKPSAEIYEYVIKEIDIEKEHCLFIDDSLENVIEARKVGMESEQFIEYESFIELINAKYSIN
jgi:putative hydrolase of the HAD superfamily